MHLNSKGKVVPQLFVRTFYTLFWAAGVSERPFFALLCQAAAASDSVSVHPPCDHTTTKGCRTVGLQSDEIDEYLLTLTRVDPARRLAWTLFIFEFWLLRVCDAHVQRWKKECIV